MTLWLQIYGFSNETFTGEFDRATWYSLANVVSQLSIGLVVGSNSHGAKSFVPTAFIINGSFTCAITFKAQTAFSPIITALAPALPPTYDVYPSVKHGSRALANADDTQVKIMPPTLCLIPH